MILSVVESPWLSNHDTLQWSYQGVARISGFELEENSYGFLRSVLVGTEEQLISSIPTPLIALAQYYPNGGNSESPFPGWKIAPIVMKTIYPGNQLRVYIDDFQGRIRPFGSIVR